MGNVAAKRDKAKCFDIVANGDVKKLEKIIRKHPDFCDVRNGPKGEGMSLLILASFLDHPKKVDMLLKEGAHPDYPCAYGVTALHLACLHGHIVIVRSLLAKGAKPETRDMFGQSALHYAAACVKINRCEIMQLLIDTKINLNMKDKHNRTALHMACLVHHLNIAEQLLKNGIDVFLKDKSGRDALNMITNEPVRTRFSQTESFKESIMQHDVKPFLIVLHQKNLPLHDAYMHLQTVLTENKVIDYRKVFNIEELRIRICSYL